MQSSDTTRPLGDIKPTDQLETYQTIKRKIPKAFLTHYKPLMKECITLSIKGIIFQRKRNLVGASLEVEEDCQHKLMNNCDKKSSGVVSNHLNWGGVKKNNSYIN